MYLFAAFECYQEVGYRAGNTEVVVRQQGKAGYGRVVLMQQSRTFDVV
jgi:hypothetical protein